MDVRLTDPTSAAGPPASGGGGVPWRRSITILLVAAFVAAAVVAVARSEGFPATDALAARATRWFVHRPSGRVVLADGYDGVGLARLALETPGAPVSVADGGGGAYVLDPSAGEATAIDTADLRLGSPSPVGLLEGADPIAGVGPQGLVVVNPSTSQGSVVTPAGEEIAFSVDAGPETLVAPDGTVWSVTGDDLIRTSPTGAVDTVDLGVPGTELTLVGTHPVVLDRSGARLRTATGRWVGIKSDVSRSELVLQRPGPAAECAWVGADDEVWCVGDDGVEESATVSGLGIDGSDQLAVAGDAAAVIRRAPTEIVRFDWRSGTRLDDVVATVTAGAALAVTSTPDLVWIDDVAGDLVWAVNPWGIRAIRKDDQAIPLLGDEGVVVDDEAAVGDGVAVSDQEPENPLPREPDNDGIDDPPIAVDDEVRARAGTTVAIPVTANDYDPDGEAILVSAVDSPGNGASTVVSATTVSYTPADGFVGDDRFGYTIVDGNGTEASATVAVELVGPDAVNGAPEVVDDAIDTGAGVPVVVDVLANDLDPERDLMRLAEYTAPQRGGKVTEVVGPSGLAALRFEPDPDFSGTATFTYRAADVLDAVSEPATVRVAVADAGADNRPPLTQPDAIRVRRNVASRLPALLNDHDPDGDPLAITVVEPLPPALDVAVEGEELAITARAGSAPLIPFSYEVDDGRGGVARGGVLVHVEDAEANRPPLVNPDTASVVVGNTTAIDVLANDIDPDGDPLVIVGVGAADLGGRAVVSGSRVQYVPPDGTPPDQAVRFTYTVSDGVGHEVSGEVSVRVLLEPPALPPWARDDSSSTYVDEAVDIDVLRNDGDSSGIEPSLAGAPSCPPGAEATVTAEGRIRFVPPPGRTGVFRCAYQVVNTRGLTATADIVVTVQEPPVVNQPPVVVDEEVTVDTGGTVDVDVLVNDSDPDGGSLSVTSSTAPTLGTASREGSVISYRAPGTSGVASITYEVADADGAVAVGRLTVRVVEPEPIAPIASDDARTIAGPGVPTSFAVLRNDVDPDSTSGLKVVGARLTEGPGSVTRSGNVVTLTPPPEFVGVMVASYTIEDADGLTAAASVRLTVEPPANQPPIATDDLADVGEGDSVTVDVLSNDRDPDNDPLTLTLRGSGGSLGDASVSGSAITFRAASGTSGTAEIGYQISDGQATADATLRIEVRACEAAPPEAPDVSLFTGYQQPLSIDLTTYARNGTVTSVGPPLGAPSGTYTPPAGENGNVSFDYVVEGPCDRRDTGTVTIDVNRDPEAGSAAVTMRPGERRTIVAGDLATDDERLSIVGLGGAPGWVSIAGGGSAIELRPDRAGEVSFSATVADPGGLSARATVTVIVSNGAPVANADQVDVSEGAVTIDLLDNDNDPDGDDIRLQSVPGAAAFDGSGRVGVVRTGPRTVRISPTGGADGTAAFSYTIVDSGGRESNAATVTVVSHANHPPMAEDVAATVEAGSSMLVPLNASDPDGDDLTVTVSDVPGGISVSREGLAVRVQPQASGTAATYTFTYTVTDPGGLRASAEVRIDASPTPTTPPPTTTTQPPTTTVPPPTTTPPPPPTTTTLPPTTLPPPPTTLPPTPTTVPAPP